MRVGEVNSKPMQTSCSEFCDAMRPGMTATLWPAPLVGASPEPMVTMPRLREGFEKCAVAYSSPMYTSTR
jgi:hypothetical protein